VRCADLAVVLRDVVEKPSLGDRPRAAPWASRRRSKRHGCGIMGGNVGVYVGGVGRERLEVRKGVKLVAEPSGAPRNGSRNPPLKFLRCDRSAHRMIIEHRSYVCVGRERDVIIATEKPTSKSMLPSLLSSRRSKIVSTSDCVAFTPNAQSAD
jgi:hypothetical protein